MIYNGELLQLYLKLQDKWQVLGGMRTTKLVINNQPIDASNYSNGPWRSLLDEAGTKYVSITGIGAFTDNENALRLIAMNNKIEEYKLEFANGDVLIGKFQITYYEHAGSVSKEENYVLSIESSGKMIYY